MNKVIITGGRDYSDYVMFEEVMNVINPSIIVQGGATGADQLAREWADIKELECITYDADWNKNGKAAGPIRNRQMLKDNPDAIVIAFPGGKGTANCIKEAIALNMIVLEVR